MTKTKDKIEYKLILLELVNGKPTYPKPTTHTILSFKSAFETISQSPLNLLKYQILVHNLVLLWLL